MLSLTLNINPGPHIVPRSQPGASITNISVNKGDILTPGAEEPPHTRGAWDSGVEVKAGRFLKANLRWSESLSQSKLDVRVRAT